MKRHREDQAPAPDVPDLWPIALPLISGMAIGAVVICVLRWSGLRWTWALPGLPLTYLLATLGAGRLAFTIGLASAVAIGVGIYWHSQDHYRGGEDARRAHEAIGPMHAIRALAARRRAARRRIQPARTRRLDGARGAPQIALGVDARGGTASVPLGIQTGVHSLVLGATGSGKTVTQAALAQAHIRAGLPVIALDPKGDDRLREVLAEAAAAAGVSFRCWSHRGRSVYNPFARGGPTEIADKALAGHEWSEPHYELATQRLLLHVTHAMRATGNWPPTLSTLVRYMDPERLDLLANDADDRTREEVSAYVDGLSGRAKSDLGGGRDRLAVLADGELGPRLDPTRGAGDRIDLARAFASARSSTSTSTPTASPPPPSCSERRW